MVNEEIRDVIRDFVNFDVESNYYQKEDKEELVRQFKKIVYEDDTTVRQFLKALFVDVKKLAGEYSLIASEGESEEIPVEIEEPIEGEVELEEPEDSESEEVSDVTAEESVNRYRRIASDLLYE